MKKIGILFTLFLIILAGVIGFSLTKEAESGAGDNVSGWAWIGADCTDINELTRSDNLCNTGTTDPIGWISFNDTNPEITCSGVSYGVNVDYSSGEISGSAWLGVGENNVYTDCNTSENTVGWLYFDSLATPSCGSGGYPSDYCFPAKIVGNEIQGWAPIISKDSSGSQTTVTWVRFKGSNYSIKINNDGTVGSGVGATDHYAWSNVGKEGGFGWIDFSRVRFSPINQPPEARNLKVDTGDYCGAPYPPIYLSWTFSDPDGDSQSAYQVQIDNNSDFSSPEKDTGKVNSSSNTYAPPNLSYNTTYYWRVKVWDSKDVSSDWATGRQFTTEKHPYPSFASELIVQPKTPRINQNVLFTDYSTVYGGATKKSWNWTFQDGNPASSNQQNPTIQFRSVGPKGVSLKITDSDNYFCTDSKSVTVQTVSPSPEWKEIPPIF